jgi:tetratricopeptide (TPR) repeat protein
MNTARLTAYFFGGQFEETVIWARRVLAQNPRSSPAVRTLAASLALLGRTAEAAEVFKESVAIDPNLTITKQRQKLVNWPDHAWQYMSEGLRLAGMPE